MKLRCLIFGLLLTTTAAASTPSDYAQQWPVNAQGEGAYAIKLNEEIYRIIQKNDLSDLSAFNAAGEALPFGPMPASYSPLPASWVQARAFPLPKEASQNPEQLRLHVQRSAAGDLSLDANFAQQASVGDSHDWIIDLDSDDQGIEALQVELSDNAGDFNAQLTVLASDDLQQWQSLQTASIVSLQQDGQRLQRLLRVGAHGDAGDIHIAVGDGLLGDVFLAHGLAAGGELGDRAQRRGLRHLATR
ncbi:MAG TPA: DUF3999 family protein, partial [Arenimonas sp.]|nr:DUF3999 family protein [Arenimonas sp.]